MDRGTEIRLMRTLLEGARKRIEEGSTRYLCYALDEARETLRKDEEERRRFALGVATIRLKRWIDRQLGGRPTYALWLKAQHPEAYARGRFASVSTAELRQARLQWIDHMLGVLDEMLMEL